MTTTDTVTSLESYNPATGEVVGEVTVTPVARIPEVLDRARRSQSAWAALSPEERGAFLIAAGPDLVARAEELGSLLTREMGKPLREAIDEVKSCGTSMEATVAEVADAIRPDEVEDERTRSTVYHDPYGVCVAITPWNFPISMPHWLVVPALVAGNTVVLKPSEETPLIAQAYVDVLNAHLPLDILQIVHGADEQGKALVAGPVDLVAFTGSREAGKHILAAASSSLTRVILELGGKDPMVILEDADLARAASFAAASSFRNAGQVCVSTERIYVHERIAPDFVKLLVERAGSMAVGNGMEDDTKVGPMISARQRDHVLAQIRTAVEAGATVATGGATSEGLFIRPTVLTDLDHGHEIMREETFGPVACVMTYRDDDEAVTLANDSPFGLGAVVFGADEERAAQVARRLSAGMIGINRGCGGASGTPWVGARESGYGYHHSKDGHRQFTQARVVSRRKD
jgi:acyl-CoA reductase-like NAD-dependent aldehyde dehydrogenase